MRREPMREPIDEPIDESHARSGWDINHDPEPYRTDYVAAWLEVIYDSYLMLLAAAAAVTAIYLFGIR